MEAYARALVPRLPDQWPDARFVAYVSTELAEEWRAAPWDPRIELRALPSRAASRVRRTVVEQWLAGARVDVLHSLANIAPVWTRARSVVTVHDLIYLHYPDAHEGLLTRGVAALVARSVRGAARIVAVSQATGDDVARAFGVGRIDVVPSGPGAAPGPATPEAELRARLALTGPVILAPSAHRAHKNLPRLVEATGGIGATLVLPGYPTGQEDGLRADHVRVTGWVTDADLEGLYSLARCLVFPSLYEGFGLPVLEAMVRGLPVACSNTSSLPEVAGDAALLFDPTDTDAIRAAVTRLLADDALCADLVARGRAQAARFDWDTAAAGTVAAYRAALA